MTMRSLRSTAGFSLIELLVAITMLIGVTGAGYALFKSQSTSFRENTQRYDLVQNARGSLEWSDRVIRTMGAGVVGQQPMLVYGNDNVIAFNADFVERDTTDMRWAAYWNPDVPVADAQVWNSAAATAVPRSSPAYTYPTATYQMSNGALSPAETYILYFELDAGTTRADDYILYQRVNAGTPEILARNLLPASSGAPFFQYLLHRVLPSGDTLFLASGTLLPLTRRQLVAGISASDSANYVRPDSVRAVRMNYRVTNGQAGAAERIREVSTVIETPNNGIPMPTVCGRSPLPPAALTAVEVGTGEGSVQLAWSASTDQESGEVDVRQYVVWRRLATATVWAEPLLVVRTEPGQATYTSAVTDNIPGTAYRYAVAAQDCTPNLSTMVTADITLSPAGAP
jgi:type II secretory pathway pseudopilin PulG